MSDFAGNWAGVDDGRLATLGITRHAIPPTSPATQHDIHLVLRLKVAGTHPAQYRCILVFDSRSKIHRIRSVFAPIVGTNEQRYFELFLHTRDANYMSGLTQWQGQYYGLAFERQRR